MNQSLLMVLGVVLTASILGANHLNDKIIEYRSLEEGKLSCHSRDQNNEIKILGHSEVIHFGDTGSLVYDAKIDSGALTSSIHATRVETLMKLVEYGDGAHEVMFVKFETEDDMGKKQTLEKMVSRVHQVKSASGVTTRYFFQDTIWINNKKFEIEINLADRSHLSKKMILGKNLINHGYLIDTSKAYVLTTAIVAN